MVTKSVSMKIMIGLHFILQDTDPMLRLPISKVLSIAINRFFIFFVFQRKFNLKM